ncbi:hypothetical protein NM688_g6205 [Phlebia brevispora]|uniref:Uncharacterized protein n=1 Tax=Phlebia brevispora TaxID=194682 RepID=A0ACC1SIN6_9APHY|nr:hypothetical protein NM688_g6205 [Phlebia brevispora]
MKGASSFSRSDRIPLLHPDAISWPPPPLLLPAAEYTAKPSPSLHGTFRARVMEYEDVRIVLVPARQLFKEAAISIINSLLKPSPLYPQIDR